jgi:hypothetical protein
MASKLNGNMARYQGIADEIFGYFEENLMGDGANTFNEYKGVVTAANVGPLDKELWDLSVKLESLHGGSRKRKTGGKKTRKNRK